MKINAQELKFSAYSQNLYLQNKNIDFDENNVIALVITHKNNITQNDANFENVEQKETNNKKTIFFKEFKVFFNDGEYTKFTVYDSTEIENTLRKFRKITNYIKPLMFDNFLEQSPLIINSDNYCYVKKENIEKTTVRNGHKDLGGQFYALSNAPSLILPQELQGQINFNILELDLGKRKIKLNMYIKKTLEHNQLYAPGLISIRQKIKKML